MSAHSTPFSLGFFSDVQYANQATRGVSHYRDSLRFLTEAVKCFNESDLQAVINLGDLVDSNNPAYLDAALSVLDECIHPIIHVLGNHDLLGPVPRQEVISRLNMEKAWGECFSKNSWRVVVVDSTEVSMHSAEKALLQESASQILHLNDLGDPCAEDWNGMASIQQLQELYQLFSDNRCVAAHFNGHDHDGGFTTDIRTGVHYLTFAAICDSGGRIGAHAIARFDENSITVKGWGRIQTRTLHCNR